MLEHADHRRFALLGLLHQLNDPAKGGLLASADDFRGQKAFCIDRARSDLVAQAKRNDKAKMRESALHIVIVVAEGKCRGVGKIEFVLVVAYQIK
ncbi:MAG: hypothetical protein AAGC81_19640, partial [Pseudomonadota bacterium]